MKTSTIEIVTKIAYLFIALSCTLILFSIVFPSLISTDKLPIYLIIPLMFGIVLLWFVLIFWLLKMMEVKKEIKKIDEAIKRHNSN